MAEDALQETYYAMARIGSHSISMTLESTFVGY